MNLRTGPSCIITVFLLLLALCHGAATEKQSNVKGRRRAQGAPGPGDKGALSTDSKDKRKGKTVTLKGLKSILLTETNEEFSASSNSTVNQDMFQAAGDNQLELALLAENRTIDYMKATGETVPLPTYPFIICHEAQNISGYQRMADISILGASHAEALLNADQHSCWFVQSVASNASALVAENANLSIAAVGPYCKLRQGIIDAIENEGASEFLVQLCPGALKPEPGAPPGRPGPNGDSLDMVWQDILSSLQTFVDTNMTADTSNNTGARKLQNQRSLVTENFFWTHLLERTPHFQNSGGRKLISEHPRAAMWARALQEGIDSSHHCSDMFRELHMSPLEDGNSFRLQIGGSFDLGSGSNRRLESFTQPSTHCVLSLIAGVSQNPAVCSVVNAPAVSLHNHQAAWIVQSGQPDYRSWFEAGIRGKNQVVAIADTGVDSNHCYFTDGEPFDKSGIVDFSRRKVIHYKGVDNMDSIGGHGTHAAGTIAGALSSGYGMSEGIARDAKLSVFDISDDSNMTDPVCCKLPKDWTRILNISYTNATARVQSFSWGARYNQYHTYDQWMDTFVYNNPDMVIVVAAGNTGASYAVGSPAVAKNVIAVGSTFSAGSDIKSGGSDQHYLSTFSSRGPTADGRIKPDVVAPGQSILSARARPDLSSTCDPASAPELGKSSGGLMYRMGTSMSTPVVSGTVALIRQYFQEGWFVSGSKNEAVGFNPSAALVKAILINGAQSLLGIGTTSGNITDIDYNQGFGRINLHNVVPFGNNSISLIAGKDKVITNGEIHSLSIQIQLTSMCSLSEVTVSLVWTDPPAATACSNCVLNHLDLSLIRSSDSSVFYPNGLDSKDTVNNVERIRASVSDQEVYTIRVEATNLSTESQNYALVASGCFQLLSDGSNPAPLPRSPVARAPRNLPVSSPSIKPFDGSNGAQVSNYSVTSAPTKYPFSSSTTKPTASKAKKSTVALRGVTNSPTTSPFAGSSAMDASSGLAPFTPNQSVNFQLQFSLFSSSSSSSSSYTSSSSSINSDKNSR